MSHDEILQLLTPLVAGGIFAADIALEGAALDIFQADLETLRQLIITDSAELTPSSDRLKLVPIKGDIKKPYYIALAAALGFTIRIDDYIAPIIGYFAIGDELVFEPWQDFSAGVSGAGDNLSMGTVPALLPACWRVIILAGPLLPSPALEAMLLDLAPAHIKMNFIYLEA